MSRPYPLLSAIACVLLLSTSATLASDGLVEPTLHLTHHSDGALHVALTLDACSGATDERILSTLMNEEIPATIFVTARWIHHNKASLALLESRPDLFRIENHGEKHIPAVDRPVSVYGIAAAGSPEAVAQEVAGGAAAILANGAPAPRWFRGATARYSRSAISEIEHMGYAVAGYSVNGDGGSLLPPAQAEKRIANAKNGDVIIAHINQPTHAAGEGVVRGILALKARGAVFEHLDEPEAMAGGMR